ncbi:nucleotide-diphospho-sugar transferase [Aspergillus coremiiformis]|uniref:Nucleotide-diphospho-sugar transferase n=1 Tax=Aspergillus coremiiformis TaxID=138285 RepID=A0A5N6Z9N0_9EURO|nr:nucleotide-diphospho-sugar transferase [Aspergillus coremiiformis]
MAGHRDEDPEKLVVSNVYEGRHNLDSFESQEEFSPTGVMPIRPGHISSDTFDTTTSFASTPSGSSPSLFKELRVDEPGASPASAPNISILHGRDDAEIWKGWKRAVYSVAPLLTIVNTGVFIFYLALRIYCIVMAQRSVGIYYGGAWVFVIMEMAVAIPSLIHNCWTIMAWKKRTRPKFRLTGDEVPTVDVVVTCCGEEDAVVLDTVRGACDQDYPRNRFRVIVLDDAKSATLKAAIHDLATLYSNLFYMAREKVPGKPHHFKAGNLNYGLDQVQFLPGGAGQYLAALDADMIPEKDWLRAVLPHLLVDRKVALACPPQLFYNTPAADPLGQSLDFFVHIIEPIKDALGVAWCTGSGYVVRREALEDIGNFPLGTLTEDVATSTLMLGKGWKTVYIHEPLQFGTVPEDFGGHLKQRTRWAIGTVDTAMKLNFCLWGESVQYLTFAQRFSGFIYAILNLCTLTLTASLFTIPIILLWGKPLVAYANGEQLHWLIWASFISTVSNRLCEIALFTPAGYHTGQRNSRFQLWMSPYIALCMIRSFILPKWLGGQAQAFKPTGSLSSALHERDPQLMKNMFVRLRVMLLNYMAFFHLGFVYVTLVAVIISSYRCFAEESGAKDIIIGLITHAFWPPFAFFFICSSMWTPIAYAIDPPAMPDREDLLTRDPKTGVAHPTAESKKIAFGGQLVWFEVEYSAATIATVLVFAYSFFF